MGYAIVMGFCVACGNPIQFNPRKVPAIQGEPIVVLVLLDGALSIRMSHIQTSPELTNLLQRRSFDASLLTESRSLSSGWRR